VSPCEWLYRGTSLDGSEHRDKAETHIKGTAVIDGIDDFDGRLNHQGICEDEDIISDMPNVFDFNTAASICRANADCASFTLSSSVGLKKQSGFANHLWLCKAPLHPVPHSGWIAAGKLHQGLVGQGPRPYLANGFADGPVSLRA